MTRRKLLGLLAALSCAVRLEAQTRPTGKHRIFLGQMHGLLLSPDGTLQSWSLNQPTMRPHEAQDALGLGHNQLGDPYVLRPVPGVNSVVAAAAGTNSSFAVLADGRILAWGSFASGGLGITPLTEFETMAQERGRTNTPTPLAVRFDAVDVACGGGNHVLALTRTRTVYAWGLGSNGQLGIGPLPTVNFKTRSARVMNFVPYPVPVPNLTDVKAVSTGHRHSLALLEDGTVRAWGSNSFGQVGDGTTADRDRPIAVPGVRNAVAISAGDYFSVALLADGTVLEWGANTYADNGKPRLVPVPVKGVSGIRAIAAGNGFVAAITQTGGVMTWGNSTHYETGQGRGGSAPALLKGIAGAQSIAANTLSVTTVVLASGRILTWGHVRPWVRPDGGADSTLSPNPILLWVDGLEQP
jgi:alpha-tubulin suppressor-like RCC1 family protein